MVSARITMIWVFIRSIYRTIELANGWMRKITMTRAYFNTLNSTLVVLGMIALNVFHPGWLLREREGNRSDQEDPSLHWRQ